MSKAKRNQFRGESNNITLQHVGTYPAVAAPFLTLSPSYSFSSTILGSIVFLNGRCDCRNMSR